MHTIIKKMDNLGRIVIPKEIRKNLDIKNEDEVEIEYENNSIIIKKYYRIRNNYEKFENLFKSLKKLIFFDYFISDNERILFSSNSFKECLNKKLSKKLLNIIYERKKYINHYLEKFDVTFSFIFSGYFCIMPIIIEGNNIGSIIAYKKEKFLEKDIILLETIQILVNNTLE